MIFGGLEISRAFILFVFAPFRSPNTKITHYCQDNSQKYGFLIRIAKSYKTFFCLFHFGTVKIVFSNLDILVGLFVLAQGENNENFLTKLQNQQRKIQEFSCLVLFTKKCSEFFVSHFSFCWASIKNWTFFHARYHRLKKHMMMTGRRKKILLIQESFFGWKFNLLRRVFFLNIQILFIFRVNEKKNSGNILKANTGHVGQIKVSNMVMRRRHTKIFGDDFTSLLVSDYCYALQRWFSSGSAAPTNLIKISHFSCFDPHFTSPHLVLVIYVKLHAIELLWILENRLQESRANNIRNYQQLHLITTGNYIRYVVKDSIIIFVQFSP